MENKLLQSLAAHYDAQVQKAEANLLIYFKNPSGIGEHPDVVSEMTKLIDEVGVARNGLQVVRSLMAPPDSGDGSKPTDG